MDLIARVAPAASRVDPLRRIVPRSSLPSPLLPQVALHPIAAGMLMMAAFALAFAIPAVWLVGKQD
jgi:hypothetical protein